MLGGGSTRRRLSGDSQNLLCESVRLLKFGGLLLVYGVPAELAFWGERLCGFHDDSARMIFKYWIALDIHDEPRAESLKSTHVGLLLFLKSKANMKSPPPFRINTDGVRLPHQHCTACGQHLKDWGGKKHLMNPKGAALSDVWRDLPKRPLHSSEVPGDVLERIGELTRVEDGSYLHIVQMESSLAEDAQNQMCSKRQAIGKFEKLSEIKSDHVYQGDCISFLRRVAELHPEGLFDMAFADPPYNLKKSYDSYGDELIFARFHVYRIESAAKSDFEIGIRTLACGLFDVRPAHRQRRLSQMGNHNRVDNLFKVFPNGAESSLRSMPSECFENPSTQRWNCCDKRLAEEIHSFTSPPALPTCA
jgi:hypothetical protein